MASYEARRQRSLARPSVDLRPMLAPAINQGIRPLCIPITVTAAHETSRAQPPEPLAPDALWSRCVSIGTASRDGTTLEAVTDALRTDGQPRLADWPFNTSIRHEADQAPSAAQASVWYQADLASVSVTNDGIEDDIEDLLASGLVVALIIEVTAEFERAAPDGTIEVPPLTAPQGAYHAVLVIGARTHDQVRVLLVRNSWGPGWGAGGYGWLPTDYLIAFGARAGAIDLSSFTNSAQPPTWRIDPK